MASFGWIYIIIINFMFCSASRTVHICEWGSTTISCGADEKIRIDHAMYGRLTRSICSQHNTGNTGCRSGSSMHVVRSRCEGRRSCRLEATNGWFGDPCHGIFKYLEVRFTCITTDPCLTQYLREDNWQRSIKYNASTNTPRHCDTAVANRWFRFVSKAGVTMPIKCPGPYACGTEGAVWLNGMYPAQTGQKSSIPVCVRTPSECCKQTWNIEVKKCQVGNDIFYLHRLPAVPKCPMSYCAGTEIPCPPGYNSKTGYTPGCTKQYPSFTNVRLHHGVAEKRLKFTCEFSSEDKNETDIFEVTWWQGAPAQQLSQTDVLNGTTRTATLRNTNKYPYPPLFYLGTTISCRVRSWFQYRNDSKSRFVESNHFYAGIKVYPEQLKFRLSEGGAPMKLMLRNTVPIVCERQPGCFVVVEIGQTNVDTLLDVCSVKFDPGNTNQTKEIQVVALRDFVDDGDHTMFVKFHIFDHIDPLDWKNHKPLPDVQVMSIDVGTERCSTTGDPHLTTFDKFYYHHYQVGDYVLVKSTCRNFEVHVRTWKCASVSCNCGVAAREGDDVVVVDMCRDRIPRARFASTVEPHPDTKLQRDRNGKSFEISFPSGAFVRVHMHRWYGNLWYANIQVQVVSDDFKCTEGLCGTFDGDRSNELKAKGGRVIQSSNGAVAPAQFTESWKIPTGQSLFYYRGGPKKCRAKRVKHYCTCEERCCGKRQINCDFTGFQKRPKYTNGKKFWRDLNFPGGKHCGRRKRRSTADQIVLPDDDENLMQYLYDPEQINPIVPQWPTPKGKTLMGTRSYCDREIRKSEVALICTKLIDGFDVTDFVVECVSDIQISDNNSFVMSAIEKMKDYCEEKSLKDITLWKPNPAKNGTKEPPKAVDNVLCPNQCSGNGLCVNGTCECNTGFETADCSMSKGEGPVVLSKWPTMFDGLCDMRNKDCSRLRVSGYNFIDSENLECRARHAEYMLNGSFAISSRVEKSRGYLLSFAEVMCELESTPAITEISRPGSKGVAVGGLFIYVANSAQNFSSEGSLHVVYDSKCMNCSINGTCIRKADSCLIDGFCFNHNQTNPFDYCQLCNTSENTDKFSTRKAHAPPSFTMTKTSWLALVGEPFQMQLNASDPEKQSVTFHLKENYEGAVLSSNGVLKWLPEAPGMNLFSVIAKDRCGKESTILLRINVTQCSCGERETCKLVRNTTVEFVACLCPDGCAGPMCSEPVKGKTCNFIDKPSKVTGEQSHQTTLIIAVTVGAVLLVAVIAVVAYIISKRRRNSAKKNKAVGAVLLVAVIAVVAYIISKRRRNSAKKNKELARYSKQAGVAKVFDNDMYSSTATLT